MSKINVGVLWRLGFYELVSKWSLNIEVCGPPGYQIQSAFSSLIYMTQLQDARILSETVYLFLISDLER